MEHPKGVILTPDRFIARAEETGFVRALRGGPRASCLRGQADARYPAWMQLSRASFLARTGLAPDAEVLPGWRLYDLGWTRDRRALRLELRSADRGTTLSLGRGASGFVVRGAAQDKALTAELQGRWDPMLRDARGLEAPDRDALLAPFVAPREPEPMGLPPGSDADGLRMELSNYARHCGVLATLVDLGDGEPGLRYPPPERDAQLGALRQVDAAILERRAHRDAIVDLGFRVDSEGLLRIVPTPRTFVRRTEAGPEPAVSPVLRAIVGAQQGRAWVSALLAGRFVVGVPRAWSLRLPLLRVPVSTLAHDLGFHCLALRWVDRELWTALAEPLQNRLRAGTLHWSAVTTWFEGPLTNACWQAWAEVDEPAQVPAAIRARWSAICASIDAPAPSTGRSATSRSGAGGARRGL